MSGRGKMMVSLALNVKEGNNAVTERFQGVLKSSANHNDVLKSDCDPMVNCDGPTVNEGICDLFSNIHDLDNELEIESENVPVIIDQSQDEMHMTTNDEPSNKFVVYISDDARAELDRFKTCDDDEMLPRIIEIDNVCYNYGATVEDQTIPSESESTNATFHDLLIPDDTHAIQEESQTHLEILPQIGDCCKEEGVVENSVNAERMDATITTNPDDILSDTLEAGSSNHPTEDGEDISEDERGRDPDYNVELDQTDTSSDESSEDGDAGIIREDDQGRRVAEEETEPVDASRKRKRSKKADQNSWGQNQRKMQRMMGAAYLGRKKGTTSFTEAKPPKAMKARCLCGDTLAAKTNNDNNNYVPAKRRRNITFQCRTINDNERYKLFQQFWGMSWEGKKIFVTNNVERGPVECRRTEAKNDPQTFRRHTSLKYFLKPSDGGRIRVCKKMFLNTLNIGEWSVLNWTKLPTDAHQNERCTPSISRSAVQRKKEAQLLKQSVTAFLNSLPKMESHYSRKDTSKLYLETFWQSKEKLYLEYVKQNGPQNLACRTLFKTVFDEMNLSLYQPKKDQCDVCCSYKEKNVEEAVYLKHIEQKERAREEKRTDKEESGDDTMVLTMDLQAVLLCPKVNASALYYKTKLKVHNFTIYNVKTKDTYCYFWDESQGGVTGDEFATILFKFVASNVDRAIIKTVIVYSDGCTYQNRNVIMANAMLLASKLTGLQIIQKYLTKGHTQMEVDSVHATIERELRNRDVYLPSGYISAAKMARRKPKPYEVIELNYSYFLNFRNLKFVRNLRPGFKKGDPTVMDLKCIHYTPEGSVFVKTDFNQEYSPLPQRISAILDEDITPSALYSDRLPIKASKFKDLQELKDVIPKDAHIFYDTLPKA